MYLTLWKTGLHSEWKTDGYWGQIQPDFENLGSVSHRGLVTLPTWGCFLICKKGKRYLSQCVVIKMELHGYVCGMPGRYARSDNSYSLLFKAESQSWLIHSWWENWGLQKWCNLSKIASWQVAESEFKVVSLWLQSTNLSQYGLTRMRQFRIYLRAMSTKFSGERVVPTCAHKSVQNETHHWLQLLSAPCPPWSPSTVPLRCHFLWPLPLWVVLLPLASVVSYPSLLPIVYVPQGTGQLGNILENFFPFLINWAKPPSRIS